MATDEEGGMLTTGVVQVTDDPENQPPRLIPVLVQAALENPEFTPADPATSELVFKLQPETRVILNFAVTF